MRNPYRARRLAQVVAGLFVMLSLVLAAHPALADYYSIDQVDIDATVAADGSLSVSETREFDFHGSYNGVYWKIPTGSYEGRQIQTTIGSVGEIVDGTYQEFTESSSGLDGTYRVTEYSSYVEVKLYSAHEDEATRFVVNYTDTNLASRWSDTAELYWKFVSDGWDVESRDVTCTVHLPVPDESSVSAGDNVRAWGHGPLDANVSFSGDDVVYSVPGVGTDEYAEARIVFPAEWLSQVTASSESRLDTILSQEQQLADEANSRRILARGIAYGTTGVCLAVGVASLILAVRMRHRYKASHTAQFDDDYYRDVPSSDHPAVLAALLNDGEATQGGLSASLLRLVDKGVVGLDTINVTRKGRFGTTQRDMDYRIVARGKVERTEGASKPEQLAEDVDASAYRFLFETVGRRAGRGGEGDDDGDAVLMSDFHVVAKRSPKAYDEGYTDWTDTVEGGCLSRGFFVDDAPSHQGLVRGFGILDLILQAVLYLVVIANDSDASPRGGLYAWVVLVTWVLLIVAGIVCLLFAKRMRPLSSEAVELKAKLVALHRWLTEFTHLKEAVPRDVVLWNRLLVMATALGVSKVVIDQLRVAAPEVLYDPVMRPFFVWYGFSRPGSDQTPAAAFGQAIDAAHTITVSALASSNDSSGGGFGGGFSGGGGGGFGGGGGGGAF